MQNMISILTELRPERKPIRQFYRPKYKVKWWCFEINWISSQFERCGFDYNAMVFFLSFKQIARIDNFLRYHWQFSIIWFTSKGIWPFPMWLKSIRRTISGRWVHFFSLPKCKKLNRTQATQHMSRHVAIFVVFALYTNGKPHLPAMSSQASRSFEKSCNFQWQDLGVNCLNRILQRTQPHKSTLRFIFVDFSYCVRLFAWIKVVFAIFSVTVLKLPKQFRVGYCVLGEHLSKMRTKCLFHAHTKSFYLHFVYMCNFSLVSIAWKLDNGVIALDTNIRLLKATETIYSIMYLTTFGEGTFAPCCCHSLRFVMFFLSFVLFGCV